MKIPILETPSRKIEIEVHKPHRVIYWFCSFVLLLAISSAMFGLSIEKNSPLEDLDGNYSKLSYDETESLAIWLNNLYKDVGKPPNEATRDDLYNWAAILIPAFDYEEAVDGYRVPQVIAFHLYESGARNAHVAGTSNCGIKEPSYSVISIRYANPYDTWFSEGNYVGTLSHELAHIQQGKSCLIFDSAYVEQSAQIMSWEALAGVANYKNKMALQVLLEELSGSILGAARYAAWKEGRTGEYELLVKNLKPSAEDVAARDKSRRFWAGHSKELYDILYKYNYEPWRKIISAYHTNGLIGIAAPSRSSSTQETYERLLHMDDLIYALDNADKLVYGKEDPKIAKRPRGR